MEIKIIDAGDVAKQRLFNYLDEKVGKQDDIVRQEFFSYLLEQAKSHKLFLDSYGSLAYQQDREEARAIRRQRENEYKEGEFRLPRRNSRHF